MFHSFIVFCFFGLVGLSASFNVLQQHRIPFEATRYLTMEKDLVERMKRDVTQTGSVQNNCLLKNIGEMYTSLSTAFPELVQSNFSSHFSKMISEDVNGLDKFCNATLPSFQRLKACPDDQLKTIYMKSLKITELMCIKNFKEYKKHNPCLTKVNKKFESECSQQCKPYEQAYFYLLQHSPDLLALPRDNVRRTFSGACLYADCSMNCILPKVSQNCGSAAELLVKSTLTEVFSTVNSMIESLGKLPGGDFWPEECKRIGRNNQN